MTLAKARIINYNHNSSFIVLATVITIINYDHKTYIVQATGGSVVCYDCHIWNLKPYYYFLSTLVMPWQSNLERFPLESCLMLEEKARS